MLKRLKDAYWSDNSPTIATGVLAVGTSILFCIGVFLIFTAYQNGQLKSLRNAAAELSGAVNNKDAVFDSLTVDGESNLVGDITADSNLSVGGKVEIAGELEVGTDADINTVLEVGGDTVVGGSLQAKKTAELNGSLDVGGDATFQELKVNGDTTLANNMTLNGAATITGGLDVAGMTQLQSVLQVGGDATFDGSQVSADGSKFLGTALTVAGAARINGSADIAGATLLQKDVTFGGDTTFDASQVNAAGTALLAPVGFNVQGQAVFGGDIDVAAATLLQQSLTLTGASSTATFDASQANSAGTAFLAPIGFQVQGSTTLAGDLDVAGATVLNSNLTLTNTSSTTTIDASQVKTGGMELLAPTGFLVQGETLLAGDLDVAGATVFEQSLTLTGASSTATFDASQLNPGGTALLAPVGFQVQDTVTLAGDLDVMGMTQFMSTLTVAASGTEAPTVTIDASQPGASLQVTGAVTVAGDVDITGSATIASLTVQGTDSTTTFMPATEGGTALTVAGAVVLQGSVDSTSSTTFNDTLTVTGNMGIDGNLDVNQTFLLGVGMVGGWVDAAGGFLVDGQAGVGRDCGDSQYLRNILVTGGIVREGACSGNSGATTRSVASCGGAGFHVRITSIVDGIVEHSECARNDGDVYGNDGTPESNDTRADYYDLAENFPSTQQLSAGDVVSIDPNNVQYVLKSSQLNDKLAIGVVSTVPGITLGQNGPGYPIALSGRVPVKVTNEGGSIAPGDYVTSASLPGYAKKAAPGEKTLGQAMAAFSGDTGTVMIFVNTSGGNLPQVEFVQGTQSPASPTNGNFTSINVSGYATLDNLTVTGVATIQELHVVGSASIVDLTVSGHITGNDDTRGTVKIKAGEKTIHRDFIKSYANKPSLVASPVDEAVPYSVSTTTTGFDIKLTSPAAKDIEFNYLVQQ